DDEDERELSRNSGSANQGGAHTASELDLRTLLNPSQKPARSSEKTEFTLRDLLNSTAPARSREQTERINAWRRDVLNSPDAGGSGLGGPAKAAPDFSRAAPNSTFSKPLGSPARSPSGGHTIFSPSPNPRLAGAG